MAKFDLGGFIEGPAFAVLNEILGEFRGDDGFARPARYEVILHPPTGFKGSGGSQNLDNVFSQIMGQNRGDGTVRKTSLRCSQIGFPSRALDTAADTNIYGPARKIVQGYTYAELASSFQCSSDMKEKKLFETWQRLAYNPQTWSMGYYDDYVGSLDIYQLDEQDKRRYGVQLVECFPTIIGEQALDYASKNTFHTVSITWSFRYWKNLTDEADLPKPLQDRIAEILVNTVERKLQSQIPKVLSRL